MARKKLPPELKAKNHTFKLYDWEVKKVKEYIKYLRPRKEDEKQRMEILKKVRHIDLCELQEKYPNQIIFLPSD